MFPCCVPVTAGGCAIGRRQSVDFVADALLEAADLGGHVGFADAQDLGDLAIALVFQVQQQQRAVELVQLCDEAVQGAHLLVGFVICAVVVGDVVQGFVPAAPSGLPRCAAPRTWVIATFSAIRYIQVENGLSAS